MRCGQNNKYILHRENGVRHRERERERERKGATYFFFNQTTRGYVEFEGYFHQRLNLILKIKK